MKTFRIKRAVVKSFGLAAALFIATAQWIPTAALAQGMMGGMMHNPDVKLVQEQGEYRPLRIPAILAPDEASGSTRHYTLTMDEGQTVFREGTQTATLGYNGSFLGPTIMLNRGEDIRVTLRNQMSEETTVHWHGLLVPSQADGGPHQVIDPGKDREVAFNVKQEAATLWYHPHTMGKTAEQVYYGLAGFLLINDNSELSKDLPADYGVDDVPLAVQDRSFTRDMQLDYPGAYNPDGTLGETLLANGTIRAAFDVTTELLRLRLLNGSNARIYNFRLSSGSTFVQIASDGGLLNEPVEMASLRLTPGERAEIVVSLQGMVAGEHVDLMTDDAPVLRLNVARGLRSNASVPAVLNHLPAADDIGAVDRRFVLFGMSTMASINGGVFDMHRVDEKGTTNRDEVWEVYNSPDMMGGMTHNFHLHGTQFRVLTRGGALPPPNERGWKDTVALDAAEDVRFLVRFRDEGLFMYHCHILEHEDNGMMGQIEITAQ